MTNPFGKYLDSSATSVKRPTVNAFSKYVEQPRPTAVTRPTARPTGFVDSAVQGFKRSLPETKSLLAGAGAAVAGAVGADGLRDKALDYYHDVQQNQVEPLANTASFTGALKGENGFGEWAGDTVGNFAGQAVQSLATSAAGAAVGSALPGAGTAGGAVAGLVARPLVKKLVGKEIAEMVAEKAAKDTIGKAALKRAGMIVAPTALNVGQETGIAYTGRADDAAAAGESLQQSDALRAIAAGVPAGLLDTAAEALTAERFLRGASASPKVGRRILAGAAKGAVTEGGTEGAQAVLERAGAGQELTGSAAYTDYLENVAAGALGGSVAGGPSGIRRPRVELSPPKVEPAGPITQSASDQPLNVATPAAVPHPNAAPGSLADAANVVPSVRRPVANADMFDRQLAEKVAREKAAVAGQVDPTTGQLLTPTDGAAEPVNTRWVDEAGQARKPSSEEVQGFMRETMDAMGAGNGSVNKTKLFAAMREAEPIGGRDLNEAFSVVWPQVQAEIAAREQGGTDGQANQVEAGGVPGGDAATADLRTGKAGTEPAATQAGARSEVQGDAARATAEEGVVAATSAKAQAGPDTTAQQPQAAAGKTPAGTAQSGQEGTGNASDTVPRSDESSFPSEPRQSSATVAPEGSRQSDRGQSSATPSAALQSNREGEQPQEPTVDARALAQLSPQTGPEGVAGNTQSPANQTEASSASSQQTGTSGGEEVQASPSAQDTPAASAVQAAAAEAATSPTNDRPMPTDGQKEAGNYKKGHVKVAGLDISIENPAGTKRNEAWPALAHHYGYIKGTIGKDKDHVDVFLTEHAEDTNRPVFVVDQRVAGKFDEHKVILGAASEAEARQAYYANYSKDFHKRDANDRVIQGAHGITQMTHAEFEAWVRDPEATKQRAAKAKAAAPPAAAGQNVNTLVGRIADGVHPSEAIRELDDATARKVANALGQRVTKGTKAGDIANRLSAMPQPDVRRAAERAFEVMATAEEKAERETTRPARNQAYNAKVARTELESALRRRERNGSIGRENGEPYKNAPAAQKALSELPADGEFAADDFGVYKTQDGYLLRRWETTGIGATDPGFVDQATATRKRAEARAAEAKDRGLVEDKFGNLVTAEEAAKVEAAFDDNGDPRPGYDEDGNKLEEASAEARAEVPESDATPTGKLDDFGEKLEGARKFLPPSLKEELGDDQIATMPLSKLWPADAHMAIEDDTAAALAFAARAEVPAKPRVPYKVKRWVEQVKQLRSLPKNLENATSLELLEQWAARLGLRLDGFFAKVRLLTQLPRDAWSRVDRAAEYPDAYRYEDGKRVDSAFSTVTVDGKSHRFDVGRLGPDEVQKVKDLLAGGKEKKDGLTASDFEVLSYRNRAESFIRRRGDTQDRHLKTFTGDDAAAQARAFARDDANIPELEKAWEAVKARDNVAKADTRRDENRARVGENRRDGKDVNEQMFSDAFGFRGVQFGNWVGQGKGAKDRQGMLNDSYDALLDLADLLGIPPRAVSLNGSMGLSLGARGSGRASAHFERGNLVINLTKTRGAGSLAHEWFHGLDNYFSRLRGDPGTLSRAANYITYKPEPAWIRKDTSRHLVRTSAELKARLRIAGQWNRNESLEANADAAGWKRDPNHKEGVRPEVESAFSDLVQALNDSPMATRSKLLDKGASDGYWGRIIERGARSFENYVISKMALRGWTNDFLANIRDFQQWEAIGKNRDRYPYLRPEEEAPINKAFDALFDTIQAREEEGGSVALFSRRGWEEGFPDAVLGHRQGVVGAHPDYEAAKAGDDKAALRLARDVVTPEYIAELRAALPKGKRTLVLPVRAIEATGKNRIPAMAAQVVASRLGLSVDKNIVQSTQVSRGGSGGLHRLANAPEFAGKVLRGANYLILDDTLTQGGTLAALKTHIEDNGGRVALASALTGQGRSAKLAPSAATIEQLRERFGSIEPWWRDTFGYGFEGFTESEGKFVLGLKDRPTPEQFRDRVAAARVSSERAVGEGDDPNGGNPPAVNRSSQTPPTGGVSASGLSMEDGQRLKRELTAKWGDDAPRVILVESAKELQQAAGLPASVLKDPDFYRAEGIYRGKPVVWVNLAAIPTADRFAKVMAHEALGHYGVERVVGKGEWTAIAAAVDRHVQNGTGAKDVRDAIAQLQRTQPEIFGDTDAVAREVIAVMAENGNRNGLVQRVVAAIARFLRRIMPSRRWSDADIRDLINQADSFMHAGRTTEQRQAYVRAHAFSKGEQTAAEAQELQVDTAFVAGLSEKERSSPAMQAFAQAMYADLGTASPFFREWFGDSKVVDKDGEPLTVYHGTGEEFAAFDPKRLGKSTNHMTAALGMFFDARKAKAEHYADIATRGVPAEQNLIEGYLSIQKPYVMPKAEFMAIDGREAAEATRAKLQKDGFDGIQLPEIGQWIAFKPEQIKRTDNQGSFNAGDARMLFSRADTAGVDVAQATPEELLDNVQLDKRPLSVSIAGGLKWLKEKAWLPLLPANYLADYAPDWLPQAGEFMKTKRVMDSMRGDLHAESSEHSKKWLKHASLDRKGAAAMSTLMHDATLAGVDPSMEQYEPLQFVYGGKTYDATDENGKAVAKAIKRQAKDRGGDDKQQFYDRLEEVKGKVEAEKKRPSAYERLREQFLKLSPESQEIFRETRDAYQKRIDEWDAIVLENIDKAGDQAITRADRDYEAAIQRLKDDGITGDELALARERVAKRHAIKSTELAKQKASRFAMMKEMFESNRLSGPYFPIFRAGDWISTIRDGSGKVISFSRFKTAAERDWYTQQVKKQIPQAKDWNIKVGLLSNADDVRGAVDASFVVDVETILTDNNVKGDVKDAIWQRYLETLPDFSQRKSFIHRSGVHGYNSDALEAFGSKMFHMAHQMAKLKYGQDLANSVDLAREEAKKHSDSTDADMLINELDHRLKWIMNPTGGSTAQKISSGAFIWNLAVTPAAALLNWTQTVMIGVPVLGARLGGYAAASREIAKASAELVKSKDWHVGNSLTGHEKEAMDEFFRAGLLDRTHSHSLAGVGDQGVNYSVTREKWMGKMSFLFHHVERINRETTALAAYRLARQKGQGHQQAIDTAMELTWRVHFDLSNSSRPRYLTSDTAKVLMTHRSYSLNMSILLFQNLRRMLKDQPQDVRKVARNEFMGIMGMHALMAGVAGVPFYGIAMIAAGLASGIGDDDDDERTPEDLLKKWLYDAMPKELADIVLYGAPSTATGLSLYNRIGFPDLFFRSNDRELDGKSEAEYWIMQVLGPAVSIAPQILNGLDRMRQGRFKEGVEKIVPKAVRDPLKAIRYGREGVLTMAGNPVVDSVNAWEMIGQAAGFSPFKVSEAYEQRSAKTGLQARISARRTRIMNQYTLGRRLGDRDMMSEAMADIRNYNRAYPEKRITMQTLRSSIRGQERRARLAGIGGAVLDQKLERRIERDLGY